jgi:ribosomal protein S18 acetylase RimI-like enzyme
MRPWTTRVGTPADVPAITAMYRRNDFTVAQGDPACAGYYFTALRAAGGEALVAVEAAAGGGGAGGAGGGGGAGVGEREEVVGHLELLLGDEAPPLGRYGHVAGLEVRADRRRRGIARALLAHAAGLTRAAGGTRLEVWTDDDNAPALALYAGAGFAPGPRYLDLELAVPATDLAGAAPRGRRLEVGARPWADLRHVAGRQYPAAYCWWRGHLARGWGLPYGDVAGCGAWRLGGAGDPGPPAVVLADPWLVHLLLPPGLAPDAPEAWPAWLGMLKRRAGASARPVRTVVAADLAARLDLLARWPGRVVEGFTLLAQGIT